MLPAFWQLCRTPPEKRDAAAVEASRAKGEKFAGVLDAPPPGPGEAPGRSGGADTRTAGAHSGALVVCPEDLAGELRSWRQRLGGTIFSMTTAAVGGLKGLRDHLGRFDAYRSWAIALAAELRARGIRTFPEEPHIATFLAYAPGEADEVNARLVPPVEGHGIVPPGGLASGTAPPPEPTPHPRPSPIEGEGFCLEAFRTPAAPPPRPAGRVRRGPR